MKIPDARALKLNVLLTTAARL